MIVFVFAMCASSSINSMDYFYIVPSLNVSCPQEPCLTLSQFADDINRYISRNSSVSLFFQPGNHSLVVELFMINALSFSMTADVQIDELAFVNCIGQSGRFRFRDSNFILIKGLHFNRCRSTEITQVRQFVLEDATFLGVSLGWWGSSLVLQRVANASIIRNLFLLNNNNIAYHGYGGVIYATDSSFSILNCYFANNSASYRGGAVYSLNSAFTITTSNFTDNRAPNGGVLYAQDSSFSIGFSAFIGNRADDAGGVLYVETDSLFNIATSNFTYNSASNMGGVMYISHSSFSFVNNTIELNSVAKTGGVVYILWSSFTCNITTSTFTKNCAYYGGGVIFTLGSKIRIVSSTFIENIAAMFDGGVIFIQQSSLSIINSSFMVNNAAHCGGAICGLESLFSITASNFTNNGGPYGGAIFIHTSTLNITATDFTENNASYSGGALYVQLSSCCGSKFVKNHASYGAVLFLDKSSLNILASTFDNNSDYYDNNLNNSEFDSRSTNEVTCNGRSIAKIIGDTINECSIHSGVIASTGSLFSITNGKFINNRARLGVMTAFKSKFSITSSTYENNQAKIGGAMSAFNASFNVSNSLFRKNFVKIGGVAGTFESSFSVVCSNFTNNEASLDGGVMYIVSTLQDFNVTITDSKFSKNKAAYGGIMYIIGTAVDIINSKFYQNTGSFYAFSCNVTFRGITRFEDGTEPPLKHHSNVSRQEGGAVTSYHSIVTFTGASTLLNNQARKGGAILAIDSDIIMWDKTIIANNVAANGSGGGIYLIQCDFFIYRNCSFTLNHASARGGGVYVSGTSIVVQQQGDLRFTNNSAEYGGGVYLEISSRLVTLSKFPGILSEEGENGFIMFINNHADYGGAVYIDDKHSVLCFFSIECFIQSVAFNKLLSDAATSVSILIFFSGNTANYHGSNIFGGLFDRCTPSPFATVYTDEINPIQYYYSGIDYLQTISNITLDSIASDPARVCFCNSMDQPDCSYEMSTIKVKKGEAFSVTVVAVDQVNRSVNASIRSILVNNAHGRMGEGQQLQIINENCTKLTYIMCSLLMILKS